MPAPGNRHSRPRGEQGADAHPTISTAFSAAPNSYSHSLLMALASLLRIRKDDDGDAIELLPSPDHLPAEPSSHRRPARQSGEMSYSATTESTIAPEDADFDFAVSLQDVVDKCVIHRRPPAAPLPHLSCHARIDWSDVKRRELGVLFDNLRVVGLGTSAAQQPTMGSILNPVNWLSGIQHIRHPATRDILNGFEGVVKPGEMLRKAIARAAQHSAGSC